MKGDEPMSDGHRHPGQAELEAFALGRLGSAEMKTVEAHLSTCGSCGRRVQDAPDDHMVKLLRKPPVPESALARTS